jgi:hypothetical protein
LLPANTDARPDLNNIGPWVITYIDPKDDPSASDAKDRGTKLPLTVESISFA